MPADIDSFDRTENLTGEDLNIPQMAEGEFITLRTIADAVRDMHAEMKAYGPFIPADDELDEDQLDPDLTDEVAPKGPSVNTPIYLRERFEYMCRGWNLSKPDGTKIVFNRENRDKIWRLWAPQLTTAISARAGGSAKTVSGKDARGQRLTFPDNTKVRGAKSMARLVDSRGGQPRAAGEDHPSPALDVS